MTLSSYVRVSCILLSLAAGANGSAPGGREVSRRSVKAHSINHGTLQPSAGSLAKQHPPSFTQSGTASPDKDTSCIPRGDDTGSHVDTATKEEGVESMEMCHAACQKNWDCSHFTYNTVAKTCYLKVGVPNFYAYAGDETGPASCDTSCHVSDVVYNTEPIKEFVWPNRRPTDCHAACYGTGNCEAFAWYRGTCRLYGPGFSASRERAEGVLAGPKGFCDRQGNLTLAELRDGGGDERCLKGPHIGSQSDTLKQSEADRVANCIEACEQYPGCTHFTYEAPHHVCLLKGGEPEYEHAFGSVTGAPTCDVEFMGDEFQALLYPQESASA